MIGLFFVTVCILCGLFEIQGQVSVTQKFFQDGTNCSVSINKLEQTVLTNICMSSKSPEVCNGNFGCGVKYLCKPNQVQISYYYSSAATCGGNAEFIRGFPTNSCMPPNPGYDSFGSDSTFICN